MSYSTLVHAGQSCGQYFTVWNPNSVFWCRLINIIVSEYICMQLSVNICARSYFHKVDCIQLQILHMQYGEWYFVWSSVLSKEQIPCSSLHNLCSLHLPSRRRIAKDCTYLVNHTLATALWREGSMPLAELKWNTISGIK